MPGSFGQTPGNQGLTLIVSTADAFTFSWLCFAMPSFPPFPTSKTTLTWAPWWVFTIRGRIFFEYNTKKRACIMAPEYKKSPDHIINGTAVFAVPIQCRAAGNSFLDNPVFLPDGFLYLFFPLFRRGVFPNIYSLAAQSQGRLYDRNVFVVKDKIFQANCLIAVGCFSCVIFRSREYTVRMISVSSGLKSTGIQIGMFRE